MKKKHIVSIGYWHFALDSITAATNLVAALSKAEQVDYEYESPHKVFRPMDDEARRCEVELAGLRGEGRGSGPARAVALQRVRL